MNKSSSNTIIPARQKLMATNNEPVIISSDNEYSVAHVDHKKKRRKSLSSSNGARSSSSISPSNMFTTRPAFYTPRQITPLSQGCSTSEHGKMLSSWSNSFLNIAVDMANGVANNGFLSVAIKTHLQSRAKLIRVDFESLMIRRRIMSGAIINSFNSFLGIHHPHRSPNLLKWSFA
ncbi:hypothetical protein KIN20_022738 [Parelaphostrongylus tenuis]|uniref:Uncharacterized protein n=1 Tax=Parelaphostrongylus tenuis TaxID=148309 RepID=A0AAD5QV03_PARTN|nr:hypothetical protein KIN20_022738 [Parelaphostrongylus tenuis]